MTQTTEKASAPKVTSQTRIVWNRFKKKKVSVVGAILLIIIFLMVIFANFLAPYGYEEQNLLEAFSPPSLTHLFGTDNLGRDIFSRVLYGGRTSLLVGALSVALSFVIGCPLGLIAGFYGGKADSIIMRIVDVFMSIPNMLMAIAISATLGTGILNSMIAIGVSYVATFARMMRAQVLTISGEEYIEAARANNSNDIKIMLKHIFPNVFGALIVQITLGLARAILLISSLSFVGLGVQPPQAEWGSMLSAGRDYLRYYSWMCTYPGLAIMLSVFSCNLLGDGLRDALDPKLKN